MVNPNMATLCSEVFLWISFGNIERNKTLVERIISLVQLLSSLLRKIGGDDPYGKEW